MTPTLVVVTGPSGFGKTTLTKALAAAMPCLAVSRDEIKEGMVHATPGYTSEPGDALTRKSSETFFAVLELLLSEGTSVVADAAFQHGVWAPRLARLAEFAQIVVVQCHVDAGLALERIRTRGFRPAHGDAEFLARVRPEDVSRFDRLAIDAPTLHVDTTNGYSPSLAEILGFCQRSC